MSLFDIPQEILDARPQGAKDFDFLQGRWLIHHKKLAALCANDSKTTGRG